MSGGARRGLGQADARHLRVSEHDGRHGAFVIAQAIAIEGILCRKLGAIRGHVDELVAAGDVAGGIDAGPRGAHAVVDDDAALRRDGDPVFGEPKAFDVGRAPGGDQHLIGVNRVVLAVTRNIERNAILGLADRTVGDAGDHRDPFVLEISRQRRAESRPPPRGANRTGIRASP